MSTSVEPNIRELTKSEMEGLVNSMLAEMARGLKEPNQPLRMLHSYVDHVPSGQEKGDFITIDFGGSNMRVMHVQLKGNHEMSCSGHKWAIPEEKKRGCRPSDLFDWIAERVLEVQSKLSEVNFKPEIGFCFSFPLHQLTIKSAVLMQWNKGFDIPECIGKDVALLLDEAFERAKSAFRVGALVNDTVAVLLARSYESDDCQVGAVLGTGFNAAYWEVWENVPKLAPDKYASTMKTIINTEIGGMPLRIDNQIDKIVDQQSNEPGKQMLEKRVSGMYLGLMFKAVNELDGISLPSYSPKVMSLMEEEHLKGWERCEQISSRSCQYVACALAAIHARKNKAAFEVAMEGAVIERYFKYKERLLTVLRADLGISNISITVVDDYSAIGAAVAASMDWNGDD